MTINLNKLKNEDKLIIITKGDECYEIIIKDKDSYLVNFYERLKTKNKVLENYYLSGNLDDIDGTISKDRCVILRKSEDYNNETFITAPVSEVLLISNNFELSIYGENTEKMKEYKNRKFKNENIV